MNNEKKSCQKYLVYLSILKSCKQTEIEVLVFVEKLKKITIYEIFVILKLIAMILSVHVFILVFIPVFISYL